MEGWNIAVAKRMTPYPIHLLIDEYDTFANEVMMGVRKDKKGISANAPPGAGRPQ